MISARSLLKIFLFVLLLSGCSRFQKKDEPISVDIANAEFIPVSYMEEAAPDGLLSGIPDADGFDIYPQKDHVYETETPVPEEPKFIIFARDIPRSWQTGTEAQGSIYPGDPVTIAYADAFSAKGTVQEKFHAVLLDSRGRRLLKAAFFNIQREEGEPEIKAAVLAIPTTALSGEAVISIECGGVKIEELPFFIKVREFPTEIIPLNEENTDLRTKPDPQKTAESEQLWSILTWTGSDIYSFGPFTPPVTSTRRTSFYGEKRTYVYVDNSNDTTIHAGIDYGVPTGTEVRACASGRVILAKPRIVTGNTVILEHFPGVYSLYYHMDTIAVSDGKLVEEGTLLGQSGSTGLATGPHLHWEIRVSGEYADPDSFLLRPILDKKEILTILGRSSQELIPGH